MHVYILKGQVTAVVFNLGYEKACYGVYKIKKNIYIDDRLCGLVAGVPGYSSRCPGSISGATRLSEK
jgi:hypothetical protein